MPPLRRCCEGGAMKIEASAGRSKESVTKVCYRLTLRADNDDEAKNLAAMLHLLHYRDCGLYECIDRERRAVEVKEKAGVQP